MSDAPVLGPINAVADVESAGDFEKKHTPWIGLSAEGDKTRVTVEAGRYFPHPNMPDHFFAWIMVFAGDSPIARFDLSPVATDPAVSVLTALEPGTVVRALAYCNLHGIWAAEVTL